MHSLISHQYKISIISKMVGLYAKRIVDDVICFVLAASSPLQPVRQIKMNVFSAANNTFSNIIYHITAYRAKEYFDFESDGVDYGRVSYS